MLGCHAVLFIVMGNWKQLISLLTGGPKCTSITLGCAVLCCIVLHCIALCCVVLLWVLLVSFHHCDKINTWCYLLFKNGIEAGEVVQCLWALAGLPGGESLVPSICNYLVSLLLVYDEALTWQSAKWKKLSSCQVGGKEREENGHELRDALQGH